MKMHPIHHVVNFVNLEVFEVLFCVLLAGLRGFPNFLSNDLPLIRLVFFDSLA